MAAQPGTYSNKCLLALQPSRHEVSTDRPSLRVLHGARRRRRQRPQGACSSLPLAREWRVIASPTRDLQQDSACLLSLQPSRHEAPTDRPSLRLLAPLHCARRRKRQRTPGACSSLPLALKWRVIAGPTRHQSACRHDQAPAASSACILGNQAAMKLRLIDQACGCSTVRGGGSGSGLKVRARLCLWHVSGE